jgi:hypothetical protein
MEKSLSGEKTGGIVQHEMAFAQTESNDYLSSDVKGAIADNETEHRLTLGEVWKNHPALIWCSVYWAMCAIGW